MKDYKLENIILYFLINSALTLEIVLFDQKVNLFHIILLLALSLIQDGFSISRNAKEQGLAKYRKKYFLMCKYLVIFTLCLSIFLKFSVGNNAAIIAGIVGISSIGITSSIGLLVMKSVRK